jgi:hypothetical protein
MQKILNQDVLNPLVMARDKAQIVRAWLELEWFKREVRGLPRLRAADLIANMKRLPRAAAAADAAPTEIMATIEPTSKESLKHASADPVTTPPLGDALVSGE